MRMGSRARPLFPVQAMQTFAVLAPAETHWRRATCAEVECSAHLYGWATTIFAGSEDEALIRSSGRSFTVEPVKGGFLRFVFHPGQPCFAASRHQVPLEREPIYVVRNGDWRANLGLRRRHTNGADWVDEFANHQDRIAKQVGQA